MTGTATTTIRHDNRVLLVCTACNSNTKPRLVWIENGVRRYAGKSTAEILATRTMIGRCPWCNRDWKYQIT